jgi:hypothetical protein
VSFLFDLAKLLGTKVFDHVAVFPMHKINSNILDWHLESIANGMTPKVGLCICLVLLAQNCMCFDVIERYRFSCLLVLLVLLFTFILSCDNIMRVAPAVLDSTAVLCFSFNEKYKTAVVIRVII